jgi:hypothetical protein
MAMLKTAHHPTYAIRQTVSSSLADQSSQNTKNQPFTVKNTGAAYTETMHPLKNID